VATTLAIVPIHPTAAVRTSPMVESRVAIVEAAGVSIKQPPFSENHIFDYLHQSGETDKDATEERHFKIAGDMDISISNYYLYRNGKGNPTRKTMNKIVTVV